MAGNRRHTYDVAVIGGGASGLSAALAAAHAGAMVAVVERDVSCGLPILATGNGRCNLAPASFDFARYRNGAFVRDVTGPDPDGELGEFFRSLGILTVEEGGRLYPYSRQAASVRDALLGACRRAGVDLVTGCDIERAHHDGSERVWLLETSEPAGPLRAKRRSGAPATLRARRRALEEAPRVASEIRARCAVLAPGGRSEEACALFGVPHLAESPALCPIAGGFADVPDALAGLDGQRSEAALSLLRDGGVVWRESGEVLFRSYGLSGIVAFDASRRVTAGSVVELDLFPDYGDDGLRDLLRGRGEVLGDPCDPTWFDGLLSRSVASLVLAAASASEPPRQRGPWPDRLAYAARHLRFAVSGLAEERSAQVRRGGIPVGAVDPSTLAVAANPVPDARLFACGEALDIDADCGGFNLAWAWLSGLRAGAQAALSARGR